MSRRLRVGTDSRHGFVQPGRAPEHGTGWHHHVAAFHIVLIPKDWAKFIYGDKEHLVAAGECVHQRPGITRYLFDYSPDMEYPEVVAPADFATIEIDTPAPVPLPAPWPGA